MLLGRCREDVRLPLTTLGTESRIELDAVLRDCALAPEVRAAAAR